MTRLQRTSDALSADLSPAHWRERAVGAAVFTLMLLMVGLGLLVHSVRNHWRCDDPAVVGFLFATIGLCIVWTIHEERARQMLEMDRQRVRFQRGWGPFATRVDAALDEVIFDEQGRHVVLLLPRNHPVRLRVSRAERAALLSACQSHQRTHSIRLR